MLSTSDGDPPGAVSKTVPFILCFRWEVNPHSHTRGSHSLLRAQTGISQSYTCRGQKHGSLVGPREEDGRYLSPFARAPLDILTHTV